MPSAPIDDAGVEIAQIFLELGVVVLALALLARLGLRLGLSPIPLFLVAGLAFGDGGILPLSFSEDFISVGAEIGVILLLFMLGLEYSAAELRQGLSTGWAAGLVDFALNFTPGFLAGLLLGWGWVAAVLLGGVTYNTSSGVMAKVLADLGRLGNRETPAVLMISVFEDLANAVYLPLVAVLLLGTGLIAGLVSLTLALGAALAALVVALRYGNQLSRVLSARSDEVVLLSTFGVVLVVAGFAQQLRVSSAIGAFLVGIALSGPVADRARYLLGPLRDLFAATFFVFFGLQINPAEIPPVAGLALGLGAITVLTKLVTGWWAARRVGIRTPGRLRAGAALVPRGEFSIVIAGLGVAAGIEPLLGPLAAAYVLLTAIAGPVIARYIDALGRWLVRRQAAPA